MQFSTSTNGIGSIYSLIPDYWGYIGSYPVSQTEHSAGRGFGPHPHHGALRLAPTGHVIGLWFPTTIQEI